MIIYKHGQLMTEAIIKTMFQTPNQFNICLLSTTPCTDFDFMSGPVVRFQVGLVGVPDVAVLREFLHARYSVVPHRWSPAVVRSLLGDYGLWSRSIQGVV